MLIRVVNHMQKAIVVTYRDRTFHSLGDVFAVIIIIIVVGCGSLFDDQASFPFGQHIETVDIAVVTSNGHLHTHARINRYFTRSHALYCYNRMQFTYRLKQD